MHTLLLRLAGPMQSWGIQSRFTERDTGLEPSKSGVIGLLCAALGKPRDEAHPDNHGKPTLAQLADLRMGARVDRQGTLRYDYHTAQDVRIASEKKVNLETGKGLKNSVSRRYYLADAAFLVGLESDDFSLLCHLHEALERPVWPLSLGRKSFVPAPPVYLPDGVKGDCGLLFALKHYLWLGLERIIQAEKDKENWQNRVREKCRRLQEEQPRLRVVLDDQNGEQVRPDWPLSFKIEARNYAPRRVHVDQIEWPPFQLPEVS